MKVAIFGGGKIGATMAKMLTSYVGKETFQVTLGEKNAERIAELTEAFRSEISQGLLKIVQLNGTTWLTPLLYGNELLVNAGPHQANMDLISAALAADMHYMDLTEDVASADFCKATALKANNKFFIPQCGLAPGWISTLANDIAQKFDKVENIRLRVGALPQNPDNRLKYNITWSVDGLVNECLNEGKAIRDHQEVKTKPLADYERLSINGVDYEAFNTSGGIGKLMELWPVANVDYKTLRYPGHLELFRFLAEDMGFGHDRASFTKLLDQLPRTYNDVVVTQVAVEGLKGSEFVREIQSKLVFSDEQYTAIQKTTAGAACAVIEMMAKGQLGQTGGFVYVEKLDYPTFCNTWFYQTFYK